MVKVISNMRAGLESLKVSAITNLRRPTQALHSMVNFAQETSQKPIFLMSHDICQSDSCQVFQKGKNKKELDLKLGSSHENIQIDIVVPLL